MIISYEIIAIVSLITSIASLSTCYLYILNLKSRLARSEEVLISMQADLGAVCSGAVGLGEHVAQLERRTHQMIQRQEKFEMQAPGAQSYRHAMKLVDKGAELEEVIENCGLARGEAELVALAHRIKRAS
jgi:hypothetical protein